MTILLRNYIIDLKSEPQNDTKPFEAFQCGNPKTGIFRDHVDEVAPWHNFTRQPPLKSENNENVHNHSSGKNSFICNVTWIKILPPGHECTNIIKGLNTIIIISAQRRKDFCILAIKLIQGIDMPLQELIKMVGSSKINEKWKEDITQIVEEGVGGLMDLAVSLEKMVSPEKRRPEEQNLPYIHRTSVVGLFIRRIILCFDKLNFSEVSHLYHNFKEYCEKGKLNEISLKKGVVRKNNF